MPRRRSSSSARERYPNEEMLDRLRTLYQAQGTPVGPDHRRDRRRAVERRLSAPLRQPAARLPAGRLHARAATIATSRSIALLRRAAPGDRSPKPSTQIAEIGGQRRAGPANAPADESMTNSRRSVCIARCQETAAGTLRWQIRFDTGLAPDMTVAVRMDRENQVIQDYYILPRIDLPGPQVRLANTTGSLSERLSLRHPGPALRYGCASTSRRPAMKRSVRHRMSRSGSARQDHGDQSAARNRKVFEGHRQEYRPARSQATDHRDPKSGPTATHYRSGLRSGTVRGIPHARSSGDTGARRRSDKEDGLVMSLVENIARRQHRAIDLLHDIEGMKRRGHSEEQIAAKDRPYRRICSRRHPPDRRVVKTGSFAR